MNEISNKQSYPLNIVDFLIMDHNYLMECIEVIKNPQESSENKLKHAKSFLDTLKHHAASEEIAVYEPLKKMNNLRFMVMKGEVEHSIVDDQVNQLEAKIGHHQKIDAQLEAQLQVLGHLVEDHVRHEEAQLIPLIEEYLDETSLEEMGRVFLQERHYTKKDLTDYPVVQKLMETL